MWTDFFIASLSLAGATVLWRNWIADHPSWKKAIQKHMKGFQKMLLCGSCFTYWLSLAYLILFQPLATWTPVARLDLPEQVTAVIVFLINWMALSWMAVTLRFLYVIIQELVSMLVHKVNEHSH